MQEMIRALKSAKEVAILPHLHADGDAIASSLALGKLLEHWNIPFSIYTEEPVNTDLQFLGGTFLPMSETIPTFDTAVAIDCGDVVRLGARAAIFEAAGMKLVIDHHATNEGFGDAFLLDAAASATAEILAGIFVAAGVPLEKAATALYTGICTDTGGFRFSNTSAETHKMAAALIEAGAESAKVCHAIFEQNSLTKLQLEAAVVEKMTITHDGKTAIATLSEAEMQAIGASEEDAGNLSGILRSIRGVEAGVLVRERDGEIKVSMRTNQFLDAAAICKTLGGGGHARAAGAGGAGTLEEWKERMIAIIGEAYERHC